MCPCPIRQTWGVCLLSLILASFPGVSRSAPLLQNLNVLPGGENNASFVTADIRNGGGGAMTLQVDWGDGTDLELFSYASTATNFSIWHYYEDDNPTGTPGDVYTLSLSLSNNVGLVSTNVGVPISNIPPRLTITIHSPIEIGATATLRGLDITEFPVGFGTFPQGITIGPDNNIWFTETGSNRLGRI